MLIDQGEQLNSQDSHILPTRKTHHMNYFDEFWLILWWILIDMTKIFCVLYVYMSGRHSIPCVMGNHFPDANYEVSSCVHVPSHVVQRSWWRAIIYHISNFNEYVQWIKRIFTGNFVVKDYFIFFFEMVHSKSVSGMFWTLTWKFRLQLLKLFPVWEKCT